MRHSGLCQIAGDELDRPAKGVAFWFAAFRDPTKIEMVPSTHVHEAFTNTTLSKKKKSSRRVRRCENLIEATACIRPVQ